MKITEKEKEIFNDLITKLIQSKTPEQRLELIKETLDDLKNVYILQFINDSSFFLYVDIMNIRPEEDLETVYKKVKEFYEKLPENIKLSIALTMINDFFERMNIEEEFKNEELN